MSSTFFGLNIARSGLFASQRAMHITSHNIANANTEGYTRQRLDIHQSMPMYLPGGQGMLGAGVDTDGISQLRNEFLDIKYRYENTAYGEWEAKSDTLQYIEGIFNEPSDSGIQTVLSQFFNSLDDLGNNGADSRTKRSIFRDNVISLTNTLNHMAGQFEKLQSDTDFQITTAVDEINGYAEQISKLNEAIFDSELDGSSANDLRDQRNLLLDKLSEKVNIHYYEDSQKKFHVLINGKALVSDTTTSKLTSDARSAKLNPADVSGLHDIRWEDGSTFKPRSGELKGLTEMRDNVSADNKGIPYYMEKLNEFTNTFAKTMNDIHKAGYGIHDVPADNTGNYLFTINGMDSATIDLEYGKDVDATVAARLTALGGDTPENRLIVTKEYAHMGEELYYDSGASIWRTNPIITAKDIQISNEVNNDPDKIAASSEQDPELPNNGINALAMHSVKDNVSLFEWGSPEDFLTSLISNLGVDRQGANRMKDNQIVRLNKIETDRQSVSGVSIDEEMANMIQWQHSFNANSRMITAMDEMIETIINRMGLVGR